MNIQKTEVTRLEITDLPNLDPVRVYLENYRPGTGRITISCYDRAWVGYWGSMSGMTVEQFFIDCDPGYLMGNLLSGLHGLRKDESKREAAYLKRIIVAVQDALRSLAEPPPSARLEPAESEGGEI